VWAARAALEVRCLDEAVALEAAQAGVDEGARDGPDSAELCGRLEELREPPTVTRVLREQCEDAELVRSQLSCDPEILLARGPRPN
jgi:hypothetical protein